MRRQIYQKSSASHVMLETAEPNSNNKLLLLVFMKKIKNSYSFHHYQATLNNTTWLINSGASRHMTGFKNNLSNLIERQSDLEVTIGDDASYPVIGTLYQFLH